MWATSISDLALADEARDVVGAVPALPRCLREREHLGGIREERGLQLVGGDLQPECRQGNSYQLSVVYPSVLLLGVCGLRGMDVSPVRHDEESVDHRLALRIVNRSHQRLPVAWVVRSVK